MSLFKEVDEDRKVNIYYVFAILKGFKGKKYVINELNCISRVRSLH